MDSIKTQRVLLASGARTATAATAKQTDYTLLALRLYLNVTVASGAGGLQPIVRGYDKVSGSPIALSTGGTAIVATGLYVYEFALNAAAAAGNVKEAVSRFLPTVWDVSVTHGDASGYTYSLSADVAGA